MTWQLAGELGWKFRVGSPSGVLVAERGDARLFASSEAELMRTIAARSRRFEVDEGASLPSR